MYIDLPNTERVWIDPSSNSIVGPTETLLGGKPEV